MNSYTSTVSLSHCRCHVLAGRSFALSVVRGGIKQVSLRLLQINYFTPGSISLMDNLADHAKLPRVLCTRLLGKMFNVPPALIPGNGCLYEGQGAESKRCNSVQSISVCINDRDKEGGNHDLYHDYVFLFHCYRVHNHQPNCIDI